MNHCNIEWVRIIINNEITAHATVFLILIISYYCMYGIFPIVYFSRIPFVFIYFPGFFFNLFGSYILTFTYIKHFVFWVVLSWNILEKDLRNPSTRCIGFNSSLYKYLLSSDKLFAFRMSNYDIREGMIIDLKPPIREVSALIIRIIFGNC